MSTDNSAMDANAVAAVMKQLADAMSVIAGMKMQIDEMSAAMQVGRTVNAVNVTKGDQEDDNSDKIDGHREPVPTSGGAAGRQDQHGAPHRERRTAP